MSDADGLPTRAELRARARERARLAVGITARRLAVRVSGWRTAVLSVASYGLLTAAAWQVSLGFGLAAAGVSCFLLELQTDDGEGGGR